MSLLQMSAAGSVVILAVTAVRALALNRLPKGVFLALWAVAALRLLVPMRVPSPVSVYRLFDRPETVESVAAAEAEPDPAPAVPEEIEPVLPEETAGPQPVGEASAPAPAETGRASIPWLTVLWAAGALGVGAYFALGYALALRRFREAVPVQDGFVENWQARHPMGRRVSVRLSGRVQAPMTYGLIRPVVLLDAGTDWRDRERLGMILAHEYAHIRRLDGAKKLVLIGAVCLHWFNPLVWLMFLLANRDMELACDEQAARPLDSRGRAGYALALIHMAEERSGLSPLVSQFRKNALEERIAALTRMKKPGVLASGAGALLVLAVAAVFAGSAPAGRAADVSAQAPAPARQIDYTPPTVSPAPTGPETTARPRPTRDEVLAARKEALAGMSQADIDRLTDIIVANNQQWENLYLQDILTRLDDENDLAWNYFDKTGEIEVSSEPCYSYHYEGDLTHDEIVQVMEEEELNYFEFCEKYGEFEEQDSFVTFNKYSIDEIVSMLAELRDTVRNEDLRTDLAYLSNQIVLAQRTHQMWYVSNLFKMLHDLDYYLLRYGPVDQPSTRPGEQSIVGVYYGMLTILGADHGQGQDPNWRPADPPASPTPPVRRLTAEEVAARNSPVPLTAEEQAFVNEISREWVREGYTALTYEEFVARYSQPLAPLNGAPERYKNVGYVYVAPSEPIFVQLLYDYEGQSSIYVHQWPTEEKDSDEPFFYHTDCDEMGVPHRDLGGWYAWRSGLDGVAGGVSVSMQLRSVQDLGEDDCRLTLLAVWNVVKEEFS